MKKKYWLVALSALTTFLIIARLFGFYEFYKIPTPNMEPNLKVGSHIITLGIGGYDLGDIVCFDYPRSTDVYVKRLCGLPGQSIEMKDGVLFVNGENFDSNYNLNHRYNVPFRKLRRLFDMGIIPEMEYEQLRMYKVDSLPVNLPDSIAQKENYTWGLNIEKGIVETEFNGLDINNFGPVTVPDGMLFMLGDNRDNSLDSRFWGYCPVENYRSKLWFKF